MKRCPQCHFIYEDDQSHCDMDGTRLRHDARTLPQLQTATIPDESNRPKWRSRVLAAPAATILAGILALVYYVSMHQPGRATNVTTPTATEAPVQTGPASVGVSTEADASKNSDVKQPELQSDTASPESSASASRDATTEEKPVTKTEEPRSKPQTKNSERSVTPERPREKEKEESKVRSMFNKTKRFFKKNLPL